MRGSAGVRQRAREAGNEARGEAGSHFSPHFSREGEPPPPTAFLYFIGKKNQSRITEEREVGESSACPTCSPSSRKTRVPLHFSGPECPHLCTGILLKP